MTLSPSENLVVRPRTDLAAYKSNDICAHPHCTRPTTDKHHIWRRSMVGVPSHWVEIDGHLFGNIVGLCQEHHRDVTGDIGGHRGWITLEDAELIWNKNYENEWVKIGPLSYQPPGCYSEKIDAPQPDVCPVCGHRKHKREKRDPAKKKTRHVIMVPKDEEDALEETMEQVRLKFELPPDTPPYYILMYSLAHSLQ